MLTPTGFGFRRLQVRGVQIMPLVPCNPAVSLYCSMGQQKPIGDQFLTGPTVHLKSLQSRSGEGCYSWSPPSLFPSRCFWSRSLMICPTLHHMIVRPHSLLPLSIVALLLSRNLVRYDAFKRCFSRSHCPFCSSTHMHYATQNLLQKIKQAQSPTLLPL